MPPNFKMNSIADTVTGTFKFEGPRDQWLIDRTRGWCFRYIKSDWRYRIYMEAGTISFDFAVQADADLFRKITNRAPNLIACS
jgi:hypothetical protein